MKLTTHVPYYKNHMYMEKFEFIIQNIVSTIVDVKLIKTNVKAIII